MASIPVTIVGVMTYTGLEVGGGPIVGGPGGSPGVPAHPIYNPPVYPAHPIVIPPDAIAPGVPAHPIFLPVYPAHPIAPGGGGGYPAHPIVIPPDAIAPGVPAHPIYLPVYPAHPIAPGGPPPTIWPSPGHPAHPIAPGGPPPQPAHPIVLPPDQPPTEPPTEPPTNPEDPQWVWGWNRVDGWHPAYVPPAGTAGPKD